MTSTDSTAVTVLGLGAMGRALAEQLVDAGRTTTVWNRSAGKAADLAARGAEVADTVDDAIAAGPLVVACLLDHDAVHEVLDPVAASLAGRTLVNLTTTTPAQAREIGSWATAHGADHLDGGIMAVPEMIGGPGAALLYSGTPGAFARHQAVLDLWGTSTDLGPDHGMASLYDLALLSGMYTMFAGFFHGAAMVGSEGVTATEFAAWSAPFLAAMTGAFAEYASIVDGGDYSVAGQQSLEFSDLGDIVRASADQGVSTEVIEPVQALIRRQIAAGNGAQGFARIYEELRSAA